MGAGLKMPKSGWYQESHRHALASKGIKTGSKIPAPMPVPVTKYKSYFNAVETLNQLGGNRFIAMTGAKDFVRDDAHQSITFRIGRNAKSVNVVKITLNSMDTYDMEFLMVRGADTFVRSKATGVYNDQLQDVFTEHTGLYTHL